MRGRDLRVTVSVGVAMLFVVLATPVLLAVTRCTFYVTMPVVVVVAVATDVGWWYFGVVMVLGQRVVIEIVWMRRRQFVATVSFAFILAVRWRRLVAMDATRAVAMRWWVATVSWWVVNAVRWRSVAMHQWPVAMDRWHTVHVTMSVSLLVAIATMRRRRIKFMTTLAAWDTPERGHVSVTWRVDAPLRWLVAMAAPLRWLVAMAAPLRWLVAMDRRLKAMKTMTRRCFNNVPISVATWRWRLVETTPFVATTVAMVMRRDWCQ